MSTNHLYNFHFHVFCVVLRYRVSTLPCPNYPPVGLGPSDRPSSKRGKCLNNEREEDCDLTITECARISNWFESNVADGNKQAIRLFDAIGLDSFRSHTHSPCILPHSPEGSVNDRRCPYMYCNGVPCSVSPWAAFLGVRVRESMSNRGTRRLARWSARG